MTDFVGRKSLARRHDKVRRRIAISLALPAAAVLVLAGCMSFDVGSAFSKQIAPKPEPQQQPAPQNNQGQPAPQSQGAGAGMAYQYQFNAFYSGFWSMGWFGYKDANYKAGQGTIWKFTNSKDKKTVTFERALLKVNPDGTQWWRFKLDTGKETILYEFLVGTDGTALKVRYKDPDSGAVQEFVPAKGQQSQPSTAHVPTREELAKYKVDIQTVKVQAGTFTADHYLYTDEQANGTAETWVSTTVPGYMVKSIYTEKKDNQTSSGELIQVESGVSTALGSY
jgi:hypothetical protein